MTNRKPAKWPQLARGEGSWEWDDERKQVVLRFMRNGRRTKVRANSTTEAIIARNEVLAADAAQAANAARFEHGDVTVIEMMDAWLDHHSGETKAPATRDQHRRSRRIIAEQPIASMRASAVKSTDVDKLWRTLSKRYGKSQIDTLRSNLGASFQYGLNRGYCERNVIRDTELPDTIREPEGPKWLDADEFPKLRTYLFEHADEEPANIALLTILLTGLRAGELLALQWDAIDLDAGLIDVRRNLQVSQNNRVTTVVDTLKTKNSKRIVQMPPDLVALLRVVRRERPFGPIFPAGTRGGRGGGATMTFQTMRWRCAQACHRAGVSIVTPHQLRHTNGSMLLDLGMQPAHIAQHLGHTLSVFLNTYQHKMRKHVDTASVLGAGNLRPAVSG